MYVWMVLSFALTLRSCWCSFKERRRCWGSGRSDVLTIVVAKRGPPRTKPFWRYERARVSGLLGNQSGGTISPSRRNIKHIGVIRSHLWRNMSFIRSALIVQSYTTVSAWYIVYWTIHVRLPGPSRLKFTPCWCLEYQSHLWHTSVRWNVTERFRTWLTSIENGHGRATEEFTACRAKFNLYYQVC